jgi:phage host-nuclease inhibitor protein Gam
MRVRTGIGQEEEEDELARLEKMREQNFDIRNQISSDITPQDIPDIRRLGALSAIQGIPGVSNAESAAIEASPKAPPRDVFEESVPKESSFTDFLPFLGASSTIGESLKRLYTPPSDEERVIQEPDLSLERFFPGSAASKIEQGLQSVSPKRSFTQTLSEDLSKLGTALGNIYSPSTKEDLYLQSEAARKYAPLETRQKVNEYVADKQREFEQKLETIRETQQPDVIEGELEALDADPMAQTEFRNLTGLDYTEELKDLLRPYVDASTKATEALNDEALAIRDRLSGGATSMTDQDKILLGMAVVIPVILAGLIGGKEGALGALAGGLQGIAPAFMPPDISGREKDLKRLSEIGKEQLNIEKQLGEKIGESEKQITKQTHVPETNITLPAELEGRQYKVIQGKNGKKLVGIRTGTDELLYDAANITKGDVKEDVKRMNKNADDAVERMQAANEIQNEVKDLKNIYEQLEKQGVSGYLSAFAGDLTQGGENLTSPLITDPLTGEKINSALAIANIREKLLDRYRAMLGGNRALTEQINKHFEKLFPNPFEFKNKISITEAKNISNRFLGESMREFVNNIHSLGFLKEPLESKYLRPLEEEKVLSKKKEKERKELEESNRILMENPNLFKGGVAEVKRG